MSTGSAALAPESVDPWLDTNFGVFCRGVTSNNQPVYWDPIRGTKPHASDVGETGGGKSAARISTLVQPYFWTPHDAGFHILCIDGKASGDYRFFEEAPWRNHATLVTDSIDAHQAVEEAVSHIEYRAKIMGNNYVRVWRTPTGLKPDQSELDHLGNYMGHPSYDGKEIMVKVEAFHMLTPEFREDLTDEVLGLQFMFVSADEVAEFTDEERGRSGENSSERTKRFLRRGVSLGRFAGVYWLIGMQRPDVKFLGSQTRDQIGARMAFGSMDSAAFKMFTGQGAEDAKNGGDQLLAWAMEQTADSGYALARGFNPEKADETIRVRHFYTDPKWLYPEALHDHNGKPYPAPYVDTPTQKVSDHDLFISSPGTTPEGLGREGGKKNKEEWKEEEVEFEGVKRKWRVEEDRSRECDWLVYKARQMGIRMGALRNALRMPTPSKWRARVRREVREGEAFRNNVMSAYGPKCALCGARGRLEADHKRPWSLGGDDEVVNGQMLCGPSTEKGTCHWAKTKGDMLALKIARKVWWFIDGRRRKN